MRKSIKKNYIYNLLYQVLAIIIPIITIPYVSRVLGARNIGIYGYTLSISAYFILLGSLGISLYGQREIAYVMNNKKKNSKKFWEIFILRLFTMSIAAIVFYFVFIRSHRTYYMYFQILLLEILGNTLDISWFFQGLEEFGKTVSRNLIVKLVSLICIFLFVKTKNDLYIYFVIYVLSVLLGNLSLWLYMPKYVERVNLKSLNVLEHLKPAIALFIPQAAIQIYTILDRTMIGVIISEKAEVGFYTQGEKIIKLLLTIITAMGAVMLPRIANRFAEKDNKAIKAYIYKSFNLVFVLAFPLMFGLISVSKAFVPIFFGPGYDKVVPIMMLLAPIIVLIGMSNVIGMQYLLPTKRQKEFTISVICGAITNFTINLFLIRRYGAVGAAISTLIAEFIVTSIQIIFVRDTFSLRRIISIMKPYLFAGACMFIVCFSISCFVSFNPSSLLLQVTAGVIVYFAILFIRKDSFLLETKEVIFRYLAKKIR